MELPGVATTQLTPDLRICRLLNGLWQVSGVHGAIDRRAAIEDMFAYHDAGFTTWDLADHYGPAEDFIGEFRKRMAANRGVEVSNHHPGLHQMGTRARAHDASNRRGEYPGLATAHGG